MTGMVNLDMSLFCLYSFKDFSFLNMTFKGLHHLALSISQASSCTSLPLTFKVPLPWPISSVFVAFKHNVLLICHPLFPSPHPLLQLKNHFLGEAFPDPQLQSERSITIVSQHMLYLSFIRPTIIIYLFV